MYDGYESQVLGHRRPTKRETKGWARCGRRGEINISDGLTGMLVP